MDEMEVVPIVGKYSEEHASLRAGANLEHIWVSTHDQGDQTPVSFP